MTVYKNIIRLFFKHKTMILIQLVIFITLSLMVKLNMSFQNAGVSEYKEKQLSIMVLDLDKSGDSKSFIDYLGKKHKLIFPEKDSKDIRQLEESLINRMFFSEYDIYIRIKEDFTQKINNGDKAVFVSTQTQYLEKLAYLESDILSYLGMKSALVKSGKSDDTYIKKILDIEQDISVFRPKYSRSAKANAVDKFVYKYYLYASYFSVSSIVFVIGLIILSLRDTNIATRTRISPTKITSISLQTYFGVINFTLLLALILVVLLRILIGPDLDYKQILKYTLNYLAFVLSISAFGYMLSQLTKNRQAVISISTVVALGSSFISGIFAPIEFIPPSVVAIAKFFPVYHYGRGTSIIYESSKIPINQLGICILYTVFFLAIATFATKISSDSQKEI